MQGILAESVDNFRTILLQQTRADAPKVIMVTSAGDREGKTTVASHLAASLARSGRRTLLVDGDLRSPTIHAMFSAALEPGVCEMLRGEADLEAVIQPTQVDGLMLDCRRPVRLSRHRRAVESAVEGSVAESARAV